MTPARIRRPRYESLDAWRGVACLLVVLFHSAAYLISESLDARVRAFGGSVFDWGTVAIGRFWIGVPMFFVISGYCIAASADAVRTGSGGVGRFFVRRARRIYPPLWATIAMAVLLSAALPGFLWPSSAGAEGMVLIEPLTRLGAAQWIGNLTLTESWRPVLGGPGSAYVLGQFWTLCYEEQFYLVVGLILLVTRRWFFPGVWLVTGLVLFNMSVLNPFPVRVVGAFTDGLWFAFAAGVAVYYRLTHAPPGLGRGIEALVLALGLAWGAADAQPFDTRQTLAKYCACACLFAVALCRLHQFDAALTTARWTAPLRFCGRMCYSLYLTHPLVVAPVSWLCYRSGLTSAASTILVTLPLCALLAVGLGAVFNRAIERRFLNAPTPGKPTEISSAASAPLPA